MVYKRMLMVVFLLAVCGLASADTCGNCEREVSRDVECCHWCGKAIDDPETATGTRGVYGSRTFRACGKVWKASEDRNLSFDDAQLWITSLGSSWRCPTRAELEALVKSGAKSPFKRYPNVWVHFGERKKSFPTDVAEKLSLSSGEVSSGSAENTAVDARALVIYTR